MPRVDERCLEPRIAADQQHDVGMLDVGERGIEPHRIEAAHVIGQPRLAPFELVRAHCGKQRLGRIHRLAIEQITRDRGDRRSGVHIGDCLERFLPAGGLQFAVAPHIRTIKPPMHQPIDGVARLVGRPFLVHVVVYPWQHAQHFASTRVETDIGADRVHHVDAERLGELPRPCLERIGFRCERAHGTEIDDVTRQLRLHGMLQIRRDLHILAAPDHADILDAGHFLGKAHAAGAVDAAGHHRLDDGAHIFLGHRALVKLEAAHTLAIGHRLVLQIALTALIADRAIERMVDQQEFHHAFAGVLHHLAVGADFLAVGGGQCATCLRFWRPRLHFDQAHAAIAGDRQPLMIAEPRDFLTTKLTRLQHGHAVRHFEFGAVYGYLGHISVPYP